MAEEKLSVLVLLSCTLLSAFLPSALSLSECKMINSCSASTDKGKIDLWTLSEGTPPRFRNKESGNENNTYSWNPCKPWTENIVAERNYCKDVAVCLSISSGGKVFYAVGEANTAKFELDSNSGVCALTYSGYIVLSSNSSSKTKVQINLNCNEDEEGRIDKFVHTNSLITTTLHSKYACPIKILSTGSILLIIFFTVSIIYLLGGILYNKASKGASGKELLPNYSFWCDVFLLIQDGCVFTFDKIRGLCGGRNTSYQSI